MLDHVAEFLDQFFTWPTLPFSVLLIAMMIYWGVVACGFLALDTLDFDFSTDFDVDTSAAEAGFHASILDLGFVPLRWLNLGSVPLMIWGSVFTLTAWTFSRWMNAGVAHESFVWTSDTQIILRDAAIAAFATKVITNPLRGLFHFEEPNKIETMLGQTVTVTTSQLDESFGEVEYITEGAPLRLNARSYGQVLAKGDKAQITAYDKSTHLYTVSKVETS